MQVVMEDKEHILVFENPTLAGEWIPWLQDYNTKQNETTLSDFEWRWERRWIQQKLFQAL